MRGYRPRTITKRPPITDPSRVLDRPEDWRTRKGVRVPAVECTGFAPPPTDFEGIMLAMMPPEDD
jgi:hypothetical protein